ncbi:hypothetical protein [Raoultella planticola]|uniref:hypothetical protein n=1 Tax=Raoultella planticola TaxID=575 RepID=UPI0025AAC06B|nr:hypothetical protein [Raoultella planticola]MDM9663671.1 hypothetical protein [Raoultella planticola]
MKTLITVVLYNKELVESKTLVSICSCKYTDADLVVYNNGPHSVDVDNSIFPRLENKFISVKIVNDVNNKPLSIIYNDAIINNPEVGRFIFLDDDTILSDLYFNGISNTQVDLIVPIIKEKNTPYYPLINGLPCDKFKTVDLSFESFFSIGSGLVIYRSLVNKFCIYNLSLFDERFALYGVDFSFFRRLQNLSNNGENINIIINGMLEHSLSRNEGFISEERHVERLIDVVLSARFYSKSLWGNIYTMMKVIAREIKHLRFHHAFFALKIYLRGKHPRC